MSTFSSTASDKTGSVRSFVRRIFLTWGEPFANNAQNVDNLDNFLTSLEPDGSISSPTLSQDSAREVGATPSSWETTWVSSFTLFFFTSPLYLILFFFFFSFSLFLFFLFVSFFLIQHTRTPGIDLPFSNPLQRETKM